MQHSVARERGVGAIGYFKEIEAALKSYFLLSFPLVKEQTHEWQTLASLRRPGGVFLSVWWGFVSLARETQPGWQRRSTEREEKRLETCLGLLLPGCCWPFNKNQVPVDQSCPIIWRRYPIPSDNYQRCRPANACAKYCFRGAKGGGASCNLKEVDFKNPYQSNPIIDWDMRES